MTKHLMLRGAALLALVHMPGSASADLPPPDGFVSVPYGFQVDGLARFPDHVVVAFPWRGPSYAGGASPDHTTVEDGEVMRLSTKSGIPALYAVKKAAFDEFARTYKPILASETSASEEFFKKWVKCDAALTVTFLKERGEPRSEILERFRAEQIDDKTCHLVAADAAKAAAPATPASAGRAEPRCDDAADVGPKDVGGEAAADAGDKGVVASSGGGCSGCAVRGDAARPALGALALLAGLMAARRRRGRRVVVASTLEVIPLARRGC